MTADLMDTDQAYFSEAPIVWCMRSASASNSPGVTATSCKHATTLNLPTQPRRQPILGQIYGFDPIHLSPFFCSSRLRC